MKKATFLTLIFSTLLFSAKGQDGKGDVFSYEKNKGAKAEIMEVTVAFEAVDFRAAKTFSHDENYFVFHYGAPQYAGPQKLNFRHRLEGHDHGWIESKEGLATYSKLPPGRYTFLASCTADGVWPEEPSAEYTFKITTPFWMQWWFALLCLHAIAGLFYFYQKQRDKRLQRVNLLERDKVESQLAALKAQINPHFLFNSFNTLITVIEEDPKLAVEYVEHLSDFYRKIMQLRDKELIPIQEEIELVEHYRFLLEKRYGDNFRLHVDLHGASFSVVPLTLQLLVENAVKHNTISKSRPLTVSIKKEGGEYIAVSNNLQPKLTPEASTHFGLQSLTERYRLLSRKKVRVEETEEAFRVLVPMVGELGN